MANKTSLLCIATLRKRLQAGSLLALRAVARSAQPVQSVAAQSAARRASDTLAAVDVMNNSVAAGGKAIQHSPCSVVVNLLWAGRPLKNAESYRVVEALFPYPETILALKGNLQHPLLSAPTKVSIGAMAGTSHVFFAVLANLSLNRTLHSVPSISPPFHSGPIAVPLFRAG